MKLTKKALYNNLKVYEDDGWGEVQTENLIPKQTSLISRTPSDDSGSSFNSSSKSSRQQSGDCCVNPAANLLHLNERLKSLTFSDQSNNNGKEKNCLAPNSASSSYSSSTSLSNNTKNTPTSSNNNSQTRSSNNEFSVNNLTAISPIKLNTKYKIQDKIRSGGFGEVFKGRRIIDNLPIAIKIIKKEKISSWTETVIFYLNHLNDYMIKFL